MSDWFEPGGFYDHTREGLFINTRLHKDYGFDTLERIEQVTQVRPKGQPFRVTFEKRRHGPPFGERFITKIRAILYVDGYWGSGITVNAESGSGWAGGREATINYGSGGYLTKRMAEREQHAGLVGVDSDATRARNFAAAMQYAADMIDAIEEEWSE